MLLHLIDATQDDVVEAYRTVRSELKAYSAELAKRTEVVALTKCDALPAEEAEAKAALLQKIARKKPYLISAVAHRGLQPVLHRLARVIDDRLAAEEPDEKVAWRP